MTDILIAALALLALLAGLVALVVGTRHDSYAGPGTGWTPRDELGPFAGTRRPA